MRQVNLFAAWYDAELINCTKKDILKYLEYLQNKKGFENVSRRNALIALNHYFTFLLNKQVIADNPTALLKIRGIKKKHSFTIPTPPKKLSNLLR
jgi:site-specific recombinase XerD